MKKFLFLSGLSTITGGALSIASVSLCLKYISVESYAVIAFAQSLQNWLLLLDLGLSPLITRELSYYRAGILNTSEAKTIMKGVEVVAFILCFFVATSLLFLSRPIASILSHSTSLSLSAVARCIAIAGLVIGIRFPISIYKSGLQGLELHNQINIFLIFVYFMRYLGSILVIKTFPDVTIYFIYQSIVSFIELIGFRRLFRANVLCEVDFSPFHIFLLLKRNARFMFQIALVGAIGALLTQLDRLILPIFVSLEDYGYYSIGVTLASGIVMIVSPIGQILQPRLSSLAIQKDFLGFVSNYHLATQIVGSVVIPLALVLLFWPSLSLQIFAGNDYSTTSELILRLYVLGNLFGSFMIPIGAIQLAMNNLRLYLVASIVSVLVFVPLTFLLSLKLGVIGAGLSWLAQTGILIVIWPFLVHRFLNLHENRDWYIIDFLVPLSAAVVAATLINICMPAVVHLTGTNPIAFTIFAYLLIFAATLMSSSMLRAKIIPIFLRNHL